MNKLLLILYVFIAADFSIVKAWAKIREKIQIPVSLLLLFMTIITEKYIVVDAHD